MSRTPLRLQDTVAPAGTPAPGLDFPVSRPETGAGKGFERVPKNSSQPRSRGAPGRFGARHLQIALVAALIAASLAFLLRPIRDPDLFWHLKTGEWIWEHRALPADDPFSYTGEGIATPAARFILTSYWVSQLLLYLAHALGGFTGIVLLRFVVAAALLAAVWRRLEGDAVVKAALLLVFAVSFLEMYPVERPQVLAFVCFAALLALLERVKSSAGGRAPYLVPLLLLFWANAHGGAILGQATIAIYLVAEGAKFAHRSLRPLPGAAYRALLIAGVAGLAVSLANPNTFQALGLERILSGGPSAGHAVQVTEYSSTVEALSRYREYTVIVFWILMLLAAVAVAAKPSRIDITEAVLLAGSGYYAFRHIRYGALFMIVALPVIVRFLSQGARLPAARAALSAGALALALLFARDERQGLQRLRLGEWVGRDAFPVEAADFIGAGGLRGNMYNFYDWGGYLIWRLAPGRKVFVDGRGVNPRMHWESSVINMGFEQAGQYNWKTLLDRYAVGYAVIPREFRGERFPLFERLVRDRDWVPVFSNSNSAVFARRSPGAR